MTRWYALKLTGITSGIFLLQVLFPSITDNFALVAARAWAEPWMFVSAIFLHANTGHLLLNMFGLALFGSLLEKAVGSKRFLFVYFACGIFANIVAVNFYPAALGASGAIFAVLGTLGILRPRMVVWVGYMPMPMWLAIIVWAAIDLLGIFAPSGTANIAHLAGLGSGIVLGFFWRRRYGRERHGGGKKKVISDDELRLWERKYMQPKKS